MALSKKGEESNPFFCDDDDDTYYREKSRKNRFDDDSDTFEQLQAKIRTSERNQFESTQRSLMLISETEDVGNATAEELLRQGEQLDNAEKNLDAINSMTVTTQRQLNSIKSVFGGIKNWFSQKKNEPSEPKTEVRHSRLKDTLQSQKDVSHGYGSQSNYTCMKLEEEDDECEDQFKTKSDHNMDLMAAGIQRLKGLASGLGDEIDASNEQIMRIDHKTEKADNTIADQNKQMRRLL